MPKGALSHEAALKLVCAVCTNLHGRKAARTVTETDAVRIEKFVFGGYQRGSTVFPQGICTVCQRQLCDLDKDEKVVKGLYEKLNKNTFIIFKFI